MGTLAAMLAQSQESKINLNMKLLSFISSLFGKAKTTSQDILQIQKEGAEIAIERAKLYNFILNYSENSIKYLDKVLTIIGKEYAITKEKKDIEGFSIIFGLYIIEVIERNHEKGYLKRKLLGVEHDVFPYHWKGNLIFPCAWVQNIILDYNAKDI